MLQQYSLINILNGLLRGEPPGPHEPEPRPRANGLLVTWLRLIIRLAKFRINRLVHVEGGVRMGVGASTPTHAILTGGDPWRRRLGRRRTHDRSPTLFPLMCRRLRQWTADVSTSAVASVIRCRLDQPIRIRGCLIQQVQGIMWPVNSSPEGRLRLKVFQMLVPINFGIEAVRIGYSSLVGRALQRAAAAMRPPGRQRRVGEDLGAFPRRGAAARVHPLASISNNVLVGVAYFAVVGLALPARGAEETLFAFPSASHARRVMRVVNATKVASHLSSTARYAGLVDALVARKMRLRLSLRGGVGERRRGCIGAALAQVVLGHWMESKSFYAHYVSDVLIDRPRSIIGCERLLPPLCGFVVC